MKIYYVFILYVYSIFLNIKKIELSYFYFDCGLMGNVGYIEIRILFFRCFYFLCGCVDFLG